MNEVKSAARVLDILELLSTQGDPMRLSDIAETLALPRSSAHGLLQTLVGRGYVERTEGERYRLVREFLGGTGWVGGHEALLRHHALPIMKQARDACGETLFLGVLSPEDVIHRVCKVLSDHPIRYDSTGRPAPPLYCSAMGRVLLAHADPERVDAYFARTALVPVTPYTLTDEAAIRAALATIRAQGYGTIEQENAVGGCGVAAPVRNRRGEVIAVLNIATVAQRYDERRDEMIGAVLTAAAALSEALGHSKPEVTL